MPSQPGFDFDLFIELTRQHAVKTAVTLFCGLDRGRLCAGGAFVGDDLLQAFDAVVGEGGDAVVTDAVDAQAAVLSDAMTPSRS